MTITSTQTREAYAGNGSSTSFPVPFPFFGPDEIIVYQTDAGGVQTTLVRGADYTVSGGNGGTGTVTALVAPASGVGWSIVRRTALTQQLGLSNNTELPGPAMERQFDRVTAATQEAQGAVDRALRVPEGQARPPLSLPPAQARAGKYLTFDANGDPTVSDGPAAGSTPISVPMAAIVGAASLAAARALLGTRRHVDVVVDFGADATGTLAADTALQNAINSLASGVVYLPAGAYKIASGVTLKPGVMLIGDGSLRTTLVAGANNVRILKYTAVANVVGFDIQRLGLSGGGFSGVEGIYLDGADSAKRISLVAIEDVYAASCARAVNVRFLANYRLENIRANACTYGIAIDQCADGEVLGGWAQNGTNAGILVLGGPGAYDEGIRINGFSTNGQAKGLDVQGQDWGQVTGCSFTTCSAGPVALFNSSNWQFSGNQFATGGGSPAAAGFTANSGCSGLQIANNVVALNTFGLNLLGSAHTVTGNRLVANSNADINLTATQVTVSGNLCQSTGVSASIVEQAGSDYNVISGNVTNGTVSTVGGNTAVNGNNVVY